MTMTSISSSSSSSSFILFLQSLGSPQPLPSITSSSTTNPSSVVPIKVQNYLMGRGCKVLFNGDPGGGKTCFLIRAISGTYPSPGDYIPTAMDNYSAIVSSDKYQVDLNLGLWDTHGREDFDRLRPRSYPGTDLMVYCFDVSSRAQFESILNKFIPEVDHFSPGLKSLLLGLKSDLRTNSEVNAKLKERGLTMVSREEAEQLARKFNMPYMEVSALDDIDGSKCKALLESFATMVVELYAPKKEGAIGFVKRWFTTSSQQRRIAASIAETNQWQVDEYAAEMEKKQRETSS